MIKRLHKEDINLIIEFYQKTNKLNEDKIRKIYDDLDNNIILIANIINNSIVGAIIVNLITNNYYIEELFIVNNNEEEIKELLLFTINELKNDNRGILINYDNYPFNENINKLILSCGFKCNLVDMVDNNRERKFERVNTNIVFNDKSLEVKMYIYNKMIEEIKSNDLYLNQTSKLFEYKDINLDNTNVGVLKDGNEIIGTFRFGLIGNEMYLYDVFYEDKNILRDFINILKNLTSKPIKIDLLPTSKKINDLTNLGFKVFQAEYICKLN